MIPQWIIEKKRDGLALTEKEIRAFIEGYADGDIPDYQMSALAMAIYFRGMNFEEVSVLTDAMMRSGETLDTSAIPIPTADKHSTGGVGDKVSLVLAPLVACCGIAVPMISGRGLGITGGTLDKLESIPGYRTDLSVEEFLAVLSQCGCSIIGQTQQLAPADKKLYALRDVTGTVPSIPLIAASIMSKKLAENTGALVLDVKWGKGAFMKTIEQARDLARTMVAIGERMDRKMAAVVTDMNQPLGRAAGNAVEISETIDALRGEGPADLMAVTLELSVHMLILCGKTPGQDEAMELLQGHIASGAALERFSEMVRLQGGSADAVRDPSLLPSAAVRKDLPAPVEGYVSEVDADRIGRAVLTLGGGRSKVEDTVDHAVGITGLAKLGERVERGGPLLTVHAGNGDAADKALAFLEQAFTLCGDRPQVPDLIVETITGH